MKISSDCQIKILGRTVNGAMTVIKIIIQTKIKAKGTFIQTIAVNGVQPFSFKKTNVHTMTPYGLYYNASLLTPCNHSASRKKSTFDPLIPENQFDLHCIYFLITKPHKMEVLLMQYQTLSSHSGSRRIKWLNINVYYWKMDIQYRFKFFATFRAIM